MENSHFPSVLYIYDLVGTDNGSDIKFQDDKSARTFMQKQSLIHEHTHIQSKV